MYHYTVLEANYFMLEVLKFISYALNVILPVSSPNLLLICLRNSIIGNNALIYSFKRAFHT
jgi:hypothetical protein